MTHQLQKWDIIRVFRPDLARPHDKFCICICPIRSWFFYINSDPSKYQKRAPYGLAVANYQVTCLSHTSYIDPTVIVNDLPPAKLAEALEDPKRCHGLLLPSLWPQVLQLAQDHGLFSPDELQIILA